MRNTGIRILSTQLKLSSIEHRALRCPIAEEDSEFKLGIRQLVFGRYRVIYLTTDTTVEVLHIRHSRNTRRL
jgi:plasmid stabilization system protein ParE